MLFAKNKQTKKMHFGDNDWVVLQHLSKGQKDELKSQLTELYASIKDVDGATLLRMKAGDVDAVPESMKGIVRQITKLEYFKLSQAIKSWSSEDEINEDNIKALDEPVFDELVAAVNVMNELSGEERKN